VPVVDVPSAVAAAGPVAIDGLLAEHVGTPCLVRIETPALRRVEPTAVRRYLRNAPFVSLGVGAASHDLDDAFDLTTTDDRTADRWSFSFAQRPTAALTAALLVRTAPTGIWPGLVAESTAYSLLQSGPEFAAWRAAHPPRSSAAADRDEPRVRVARDDGLDVVTLTRPARHNALDARLRDALDAALAAFDPAEPGAIVLTGEGPSFCSGGDLDEFGSAPDPVHAHVIRLGRSLAWRCARLGPRLVVGLHGSCLGAGIELPAFAARVVAADDARLGLPELGLGLIPGAGGTVSIPRRIGRARLLGLFLGAEPIEAWRARDWGLVDELVPTDRLDDRVRALARAL
jgi:enoyl-CoA hydratase/carnithine racemase